MKKVNFPTVQASDSGTVLERRTWKGRQSLHRDTLVELTSGKRIRVEIQRDAYDFQSYARVALLTTAAGWQPLYEIPYPLMTSVTQRISAYEDLNSPAVQKALDADDYKLIGMAITLLAGQA